MKDSKQTTQLTMKFYVKAFVTLQF